MQERSFGSQSIKYPMLSCILSFLRSTNLRINEEQFSLKIWKKSRLASRNLNFTGLRVYIIFRSDSFFVVANSCKQPRPPLNGKLLLPCDVSYGSTCPISCLDGYVIRGPDLIKCELSHGVVTWNAYGARCEGEFENTSLFCFVGI